MIILDLEQGSDPWLEWRDNKTGASESAALFGKSPYMTQRELWLKRKGKIPVWFNDQESKSFVFSKGHEFEERMRAEYFAVFGDQFLPVCIQDPRHPFIIASLDGALIHEGEILKIFEAKLVGAEPLAWITENKKPLEHHWIQIQQQLMISKAEVCIYFAHDLKGQAVVIEVFPDLEFQSELMAKLIAFEISLELNEEPPMTKDDFFFHEDKEAFEELARLKQEKTKLESELELVDGAYKEKMKEIVEACPHFNVASVSEKIKIKLMKKPGSVRFNDIPEVKALSLDYLESFKGAGSTFYQAWFPKQKASV